MEREKIAEAMSKAILANAILSCYPYFFTFLTMTLETYNNIDSKTKSTVYTISKVLKFRIS